MGLVHCAASWAGSVVYDTLYRVCRGVLTWVLIGLFDVTAKLLTRMMAEKEETI